MNGREKNIGRGLTIFLWLCMGMCSAAIGARAQSSDPAVITGTVMDADTGDPLYFANVFISGTTMGCASDTNGVFTLTDVPPGRHEIIASMVGYTPLMYILHVAEPETYNVDFSLQYQPFEGEAVSVSAEIPHEWKYHLSVFQEWFLGASENARACTILNPEYLDFQQDPTGTVMTATARSPLDIENHALGYNVKVFLTAFSLTGKTDLSYAYTSLQREKTRRNPALLS